MPLRLLPLQCEWHLATLGAALAARGPQTCLGSRAPRAWPTSPPLPSTPSPPPPATHARSEKRAELTLNFAIPHRSIVNKKEVKRVTLPGRDGALGLEKNSPPLLTELKPGVIRVDYLDNTAVEFFVPGEVPGKAPARDMNRPQRPGEPGFDVEAAFRRLDRDGDGRLVAAEWPAKHRPLLERLDADDDGVVTLGEARAGLAAPPR